MVTKKTAPKKAKAVEVAKSNAAQMKIYQAQDDLRTMRNAHEVMTDPKRMAGVQKEAGKQIQAMQVIANKKPNK